METVYLIAIFVAPGMICRMIENEIHKEKHTYDNTYDYLCNVVIDSIVINGLTVVLLNIGSSSTSSLDELFDFLNEFDNCFVYMLIAGLLTVTWVAAKENVVVKGLHSIMNCIRKETTGAEYSVEKTTWDALMNRPGIKGSWLTVSIYKDNQYVTSGMIDSHVTTNAEQFEIALDRVNETKELMAKSPDLFKVEYDYYNTATGFRVIFYNQEYLEEHWPK